MFETESVIQFFEEFTTQLIEFSTSPAVYAQLGMILLAIIIAFSLSAFLTRTSPILKAEPKKGALLHCSANSATLRCILFSWRCSNRVGRCG